MKKRSIKILALLMAIAMVAAAVAACGPGGGTDAPAAPGATDTAAPAEPAGGLSGRTLYIAVAQDAGTLHPHGITGAGGMLNAIRTIYDTMFNILPDGSFEYLLVTEIEEISDIQYILHVREGVYFSNGYELTAHDIYFTLNLIKDHPRLNAEVRHVDFERTQVLDDFRLELWLSHFDVGVFPGMMHTYILHGASYDEAFLAHTPISTGPFRVVEYVVNSHLIVEARDEYWGERPAIDRIHFRVLDEPSQRVNALQIGDAQFANIPVRDIPFVESLGLLVPQIDVGSAMGIFFNMTPGTPLGTLAAREAVMHAINRDAILNVAYSGLGTVSVWPVSAASVDFEPRFAGMHPAYRPDGFNPDRARELAEQEGLVGQTIRIITNGDDLFVTIAEIIQHDLQNIGVNVQIHNFDQATYWAAMADETNYEIALQFISAPVPMALRMLNSYPRFFPLGWADADKDRLLELGTQGMGTADPAGRQVILEEMLEIFMRQHPWFSLVDTVNAPAISPDLGGIRWFIDGTVRFSQWYWLR